VVEYLPNKHKTLTSNPNCAKKKSVSEMPYVGLFS
jgi:hypothetical protein